MLQTPAQSAGGQSAEDGLVLTEAQVAALEKKRLDDEACGEIETAHPGYVGSQDTFYVGTLKGVGRVYQQTFVDTYSKVACAKQLTQNATSIHVSFVEKGFNPTYTPRESRPFFAPCKTIDGLDPS